MCFSCCDSLPFLLPPLCIKCGDSLSLNGHCYKCEKYNLEIDGIRSPFIFEGIMRRIIHEFKYQHFKSLASTLAQLLAEYLKTNEIPTDVLVPIPLHHQRLRQRGYNQAGLLTQALGRLIKVPVIEKSLVRSKNTCSQVKIGSAEERRCNVKEAFECRDLQLSKMKVLLIDDVCTTGATMNSCAVAMKNAGVSSVWGLTLARELQDKR